MKLFLLLIIAALPFNMLQAYDLKQLRLEFYAAVKDETAAESLYTRLKKEKSPDPLLQAYFGSVEALRAKHSFNPYNKIAYLKRGSQTLGKAVTRSPDNLEIRFLRFSLEHYVPAFLGYSKNLAADREKIVDLIRKQQTGGLTNGLLQNIAAFMKESGRCSAKEILILERTLKNG